MSRTAPKSSTARYRKPPVEHQFKKGISGNPRGRRKEKRHFGDLLEQQLDRVVRTRQGEALSTRQWSIRCLLERAVAGDRRAIMAYIRMVLRFQPPPPKKQTVKFVVHKDYNHRIGPGHPWVD